MIVSWFVLEQIFLLVTATSPESELDEQYLFENEPELNEQYLLENKDLFLNLTLKALGMKSVPDMSQVNTTAEELERAMKLYYRNVRLSEQELLTYNHTGCEENSHVEFRPKIDPDCRISWARLRFPNSSTSDVSGALKRWRKEGDGFTFTHPCLGCCKAKLEILTRESSVRSRSKRAVCLSECCRKSLKISFRDLGLDWIVQPKVFQAYQCKGRCRDPTGDFASTHALMQSILRFKGFNVSLPRCVPIKLRPLDLLHYDDRKPPELVVTRQKRMIVKECACH